MFEDIIGFQDIIIGFQDMIIVILVFLWVLWDVPKPKPNMQNRRNDRKHLRRNSPHEGICLE
jgi:hypothetical protein